jgi:hypothetical protein
MEQPLEYSPGICNIGPQERVLRVKVGKICAGIFVGLFLILYFTRAPEGLRFFLFLPAFVGSLGFIQNGMRFCVKYGFQGLFNVEKSAGNADTVEQAEYRRVDREKAVEIISYSVITGLLATFLTFLI